MRRRCHVGRGAGVAFTARSYSGAHGMMLARSRSSASDKAGECSKKKATKLLVA
jgi:hypothetical protein